MRFSILVVAAPFIATATALGINCRGSSNCLINDGGLSDLYVKVIGINPANEYPDGQHIACASHICAFYQGNGGGTAGDAANHIRNLLNHGCTGCGSDPTKPGNNVANGQLTCNWVKAP